MHVSADGSLLLSWSHWQTCGTTVRSYWTQKPSKRLVTIQDVGLQAMFQDLEEKAVLAAYAKIGPQQLICGAVEISMVSGS